MRTLLLALPLSLLAGCFSAPVDSAGDPQQISLFQGSCGGEDGWRINVQTAGHATGVTLTLASDDLAGGTFEMVDTGEATLSWADSGNDWLWEATNEDVGGDCNGLDATITVEARWADGTTETDSGDY